MAAAFNDPKVLKQLDPARMAVERVIEQLEYGELPSMLKIPKKRPKVEDNGS